MGGGDGVGDLGAIARSVADALAEKLDQSQASVLLEVTFSRIFFPLKVYDTLLWCSTTILIL